MRWSAERATESMSIVDGFQFEPKVGDPDDHRHPLP
jgi:hypothetical protein